MIMPASLHELLGTYAGLEIQSYIRSLLWFIPAVVIGWTTAFVIMRGIITRQVFYERALEIFTYWFACSFILAIFWPEAGRFGAESSHIVPGTNIISAISQADGAPIQNAVQARNIKGQATPPLRIPLHVHQILEAITTELTNIGRRINEAALRPGSNHMPLTTLLGHKFDADTLYRIDYWYRECIVPAQATLSETGGNYSFQDMMPFPPSVLFQELSRIRVASALGVFRLLDQPISCAEYGQQIADRAVNHIGSVTTAAGTSMSALWQRELNVTPIEAARFIVMRELVALSGPAVEGPSVLGKYLGLRALSATARAIGSSFSSILGPVSGAASAGSNEVANMIDSISAVMTPAIFLSRYLTVLVGILQLMGNAFFLPVAVLWSLGSPGHQIRPLVMAVLGLTALYTLPVVFGIVAYATTMIADSGVRILSNPIAWADKQVQILVVQAMPALLLLFLAAIFAGRYAITSMRRPS